MERMESVGKQDYENYKEELKRKLDETSENFIVIGYILKQVRDRCLYRLEDYGDIYGFGAGAYGLSKATVSRFININTKFSVGGNSRRLKPEYKGFGRSKIQEMLNVDVGDLELITADTTVDQVKELKKAENVQKKIEKEEQDSSLPLVQMAAGEKATGETGSAAASESGYVEPFEAVLTSFWRSHMDLYSRVAAGFVTPEIAAEEISPSGSFTHRDGVNIIFFYDISKGLKLRSYEKGKAAITQYSYGEMIEKTKELDLAGKPAAVPQSDRQEEEQAGPYIPLPGQTSVSDLQGVMPVFLPESTPAPEEKPDNTADADNDSVIDGEYRELDAETEAPGKEAGAECPYTDIEIKNAISFFEIEYSRMAGLHQDSTKQRNYKIALECIRRCYSSVAEQADKDMYLTGRLA